jgi:hypothetical protein
MDGVTEKELQLKEAGRAIIYQAVRKHIDAANEPSCARLLDLVRGTHRLQEVLWE